MFHLHPSTSITTQQHDVLRFYLSELYYNIRVGIIEAESNGRLSFLFQKDQQLFFHFILIFYMDYSRTTIKQSNGVNRCS